MATVFETELAAILKTRPAAAITRAAKLGITPVCGRCGGCGRFSYNRIDGSRCYGCNGIGHTAPTKSQHAAVLEAARECATDGRLDALIERQAAAARARKGSDLVMAAWKATGIGSAYCWRKAADYVSSGNPDFKRDREIADINAKMAAAFDTVLGLKGTAEEAPTVEAALAAVAAADAEFKAYDPG